MENQMENMQHARADRARFVTCVKACGKWQNSLTRATPHTHCVQLILEQLLLLVSPLNDHVAGEPNETRMRQHKILKCVWDQSKVPGVAHAALATKNAAGILSEFGQNCLKLGKLRAN